MKKLVVLLHVKYIVILHHACTEINVGVLPEHKQ